MVLIYYYVAFWIINWFWIIPTFLLWQVGTAYIRFCLVNRAKYRKEKLGKDWSWTFVPGTYFFHFIMFLIAVSFVPTI